MNKRKLEENYGKGESQQQLQKYDDRSETNMKSVNHPKI